MFIERLNPKTGAREWVVADDDYDMAQELARSRFADMILDYDRNDKFRRGLEVVIGEVRKRGEQPQVLDIGTGTGLLSLMAARLGAKVTALEVFAPMAECAREIVGRSAYSEQIRVVSTRSTDLETIEDKANIIVAEVFDTELIGEGALRTFKEALEKLAKPGCRVVPSKGRIWVQVVESDFLRKFWMIPLPKSFDKDRLPERMRRCPGTSAVFDVQLGRIPQDNMKKLSKSILAFSFNWEDAESIHYEEHNWKEFEALKDGRADALLMWWDLDMDGRAETFIDMNPESKDFEWRDHWMQAVYSQPGRPVEMRKGAKYTIQAAHDEYSLWFAVAEEGVRKKLERPYCECLVHTVFSRNAIFRRNEIFEDEKLMLKLKQICEGKVVAVLGEGSLLGLAATENADRVTIVEQSEHLRLVLYSYKKAYSLENLSIVERVEEIAEKPNVIVAEPFYQSSVQTWDNLRFWFEVDELRNKFGEGIEIFPKSATLKCVPMCFQHLAKIASDVGVVDGFDLSAFDRLNQARRATDALIDDQPLWEYAGKKTAEVERILKIDLTNDPKDFTLDKDILISETTNGIAFWMDWDWGDDVEISNGPLEIASEADEEWTVAVRQGVYFTKREETERSKLRLHLEFNANNSSFEFRFE